MSRINARLSAFRPALLALALLLTVIATLSPAFAACTPGAFRSIIVDPQCCRSSGAWATKQNQTCNSSGVWVNSGSTYCGAVSACAI